MGEFDLPVIMGGNVLALQFHPEADEICVPVFWRNVVPIMWQADTYYPNMK